MLVPGMVLRRPLVPPPANEVTWVGPPAVPFLGPTVRPSAEMPLVSVSVSVTSAMITSIRTWGRTASILATSSLIRRMSSAMPETTTELLRSSLYTVARLLNSVVPWPPDAPLVGPLAAAAGRRAPR